jgi:hypothetical protein
VSQTRRSPPGIGRRSRRAARLRARALRRAPPASSAPGAMIVGGTCRST